MTSERQETIPLADGGSMRALLALPEGDPPEGGWPVVLAIHDIFGFSPDIHRIVRRFADSGYAALAPALYDGAGAPFLCVVRTVRDQQRGEGPAFERIEAARLFLKGLPEINGERVAVTGFCYNHIDQFKRERPERQEERPPLVVTDVTEGEA